MIRGRSVRLSLFAGNLGYTVFIWIRYYCLFIFVFKNLRILYLIMTYSSENYYRL